MHWQLPTRVYKNWRALKENLNFKIENVMKKKYTTIDKKTATFRSCPL